MKIKIVNGCASILLMLMSQILFAQPKEVLGEDDKQQVTELGLMVVVANKQPRPIGDVIGDVSVISAEEITQTLSQDIDDVLKYEANIHAEDGGTRFGTSSINIRGIGGNRVAIEVDGVPNAKTFKLGSYSFATSVFPELDLIQNIEVLKGPASTLYGSDALGGIVAVNTWDPDVLLANSQSENDYWGKLSMGYDGKYRGRFMTISSAWGKSNQSLLLSATQRDGKGRINENSNISKDTADWDSQSVFAKWKINTSHNNNLTFNIQARQKDQSSEINSFIGQGRFIRTTELSADDESEDQKYSIHYDFISNKKAFGEGRFILYHGKTDFQQDTFENRFSRRGTPLFQMRQFFYQSNRTGLELNFSKSLVSHWATHDFIYGLEYTSSDIKEKRNALEMNLITGSTTNIVLGENFPLRDFPNTQVKELGFFVLDEMIFEQTKWRLIPALRFDHYDLSPNRDSLFDNGAGTAEIVSITTSDFSPKLGALYQASDEINFYAQYVRGFRAPPYDDVNIGFNLALFNYQAIPNPDLKSETSNGFEIGYRYLSDTQRLEVSLYNNKYKNLIVSRDLIGIDPTSKALIFQSRNIDEAQIYGLEIDYDWQISRQWKTTMNVAWTRGKNTITNEPLNHISPPKATGSVQWSSVNENLNIGLYGIFSRSKSRLDDSQNNFFKTPGFATFDILASYHFNATNQLRFGILNVTDKKYWLWQQVRNFDENEPIIESLTQPSRNVRLAYTYNW